MNAVGNTALQDTFLSLLSTSDPLPLKVLQFEALLGQGLQAHLDECIPSVGWPPLHHLVQTICDEELPLLELLLSKLDPSLWTYRGRSVFNLVVPVCPGKERILFCLLDHLRDASRQWVILRSAVSMSSRVERQLWERLMLAGRELELLSRDLKATS